MKTKQIDIQAKEWFDRVNGNSYFSANVTVNFGLPDQFEFYIPFEGGYDDHYVTIATQQLETRGYLPGFIHHENGSTERLWHYCERNGIKLYYSKQTNCKKRDL